MQRPMIKCLIGRIDNGRGVVLLRSVKLGGLRGTTDTVTVRHDGIGSLPFPVCACRWLARHPFVFQLAEEGLHRIVVPDAARAAR